MELFLPILQGGGGGDFPTSHITHFPFPEDIFHKKLTKVNRVKIICKMWVTIQVEVGRWWHRVCNCAVCVGHFEISHIAEVLWKFHFHGW